MRKTWVVAVREYFAAVKSKSFVITLVAMPILMLGGIAAQLILEDKVDIRERKVAILDRTGQLATAIKEAADAYNTNGVYEENAGERKQVRPNFTVEVIDPKEAGSAPESTLALSDRVRNQELFAFVEVGPNLFKPDASGEDSRIAYHSNSPTYSDLHRWLRAVINQEAQQIRSEQAGIELAVISRVTQSVHFENLGLVSKDATGEATKAEEVNELANIFMPMGLMMLMFMAIMVGATPLVQTVLEEKMAKISEVLLGSIPPFQLMLGKLLGTVGVSVTLVSFYLAGAFIALWYAGFSEYFPPISLLVWVMLFQILAVLMYGSLFSAVGAAVSDMKEAQSTMMPVMIIAMSPMFIWIQVVQNPSSKFSLFVSLFPPATPMLMLIRQSVPPGVPTWQPVLGIVLVLLTTLICVFCAGRIFRVGVLMQGKGASYWQMLQWIVRG